LRGIDPARCLSEGKLVAVVAGGAIADQART
jgi:hypothetical protein